MTTPASDTNQDKHSAQASDDHDVSAWELPYVEDPRKRPEDLPTNALNKRAQWKYEPPEEEEEIRPPTAEEIEQIRQAAHDEGREEGLKTGYEEGVAKGQQEGFDAGQKAGHEQGYQEGFEAAEADIAALTQSLNHYIDQLYHPLEQVNEEVKKQVTVLATSLARAVILCEVQTNEQVIAAALDKGLDALPIEETHIQLHIHPDDESVLDRCCSAEKRQEKGWDVVTKESMSQGGLEIISKNNAVNLSIEKRTRDILDNFLLNHGLNNE